MTRDSELFEQGLAVRREVLGSEFVDRSISGATDFNRPFQELVTEYCWGSVWARPGLERKTRSLITVAMLAALNRPNELRRHVDGALRNGATSDEIRETLMQAAIYCGIPAAVDAFGGAKEAIEKYEAAQAAGSGK